MFRQNLPAIYDFSLGGSCSYGTDACAIECVFAIVEQERPLHFDIEMVKYLVNRMLVMLAIDKEFLIQGVKGWEKCFYIAGLLVECKYVDKDYICKDDEREVLKLVKRKNWHMENPPAHYVPGNGQGCYSWDSLGHRPQQKEYVVYAKRIFKIKGII